MANMTNMERATKLKPTLSLKTINAEYKDCPGEFIHSARFQSSEPFVLKEHIITTGPYAGQVAVFAVKAPHFPFMALPVELRQAIERLVLHTKTEVTIGKFDLVRAKERHDHWRKEVTVRFWAGSTLMRTNKQPDATKNYSIILANREISNEAREFAYRDRHFTFAGLKVMLDWLDAIGPGKKYLTHLSCEKSGHLLIPACYRHLAEAIRLQYFKITLPISVRAMIGEHIDRHYDELKRYLLARGADETESLRRLDGVHFDIGKEQMGVFDSNGVVLRTMTPELEEQCKRLIRGKLLKHFA